jgi:hypothetical protein
MELLFSLFEDSSFLEFHEETRSLDISLDEDEKSLIVKLKKRTKSKKLATIGSIYFLREKLRESSLTLIYELRPPHEREVLQEFQPMEPVKPIIKPTQPKLTILDKGVPIKPPLPELPDFPLPIPNYTAILEDKLQNPIAYEEKFSVIPIDDTTLEETYNLNSQQYFTDEKLVRPEDYIEKYNLSLITETPKQAFESLIEKGIEATVVRYEKPLRVNGQTIYQRIMFTNTMPGMTVADATSYLSNVSAEKVFIDRFGGCVFFTSINGIPDGHNGAHWEFYVNGRIGTVAANRYVLKPGDVVEWRLATSPEGCGSTSNVSYIV